MSSSIYLAAPLFTQAEIAFNQSLADQLKAAGYKVYLPQQECAGTTDPVELFNICIQGLDNASMVLVILDGTDADSGSCFEVGYAFAKNIPIVGLRTDFRGSGEHMGVNLMLSNSCQHLLLTTSNIDSSPAKVTYLKMGENFFPTLQEVLSKIPVAQTALIDQDFEI
ncbi:nucleoside 2-deoxyribosyltransferase [Synechocystis sp. PCC 7509]|uniref:nucleoside 2-deoxyribosyltransferase n=1 Tax=Synechocystis sp. PCC 7509 TaxID=927677 RepID=UPI0002ACC5B5|nr:nucleoside 2-deoxyribosyltransferase [Synechocystis sp. PCC 7509]